MKAPAKFRNSSLHGSSDAKMPLSGVKICSLAINLPGPLACRRLKELGASLVKVEPPTGDPLKVFFPEWYAKINQGQFITTLNLKDKKVRNRLFDLIKDFDILITAQRPKSLVGMELSWEKLQSRFPKLSHIGIVGYPEPHQNEPSHDLTCQARAGLLLDEHMPRYLLADIMGAERTVQVALKMTIKSLKKEPAYQEWVNLSHAPENLAESVEFGATTAGGILGGGLATYRIYKTKLGFVALAALEPPFQKALEKAVGKTNLTIDDLCKFFATREAVQWKDWAKENDIPLVPFGT